MLLFHEKTYAMLPPIKVKSWDTTVLPDLSLTTLKEKKILPETMINEALLLGWNHLDEGIELKKLEANDKFKDLIDMQNILTDFNLKDIKKEQAVFVWQRLYYLNNRILRRKFLKSDKIHKQKLQLEFKTIFEEYFAKHKAVFGVWNESQWDQIINMIIVIITISYINI